MKIRIETTDIGMKQPFYVTANMPTVDKATDMLLAITKYQLAQDKIKSIEDDTEIVEASVNLMEQSKALKKQCMNFLKDILKLTPKDINVLNGKITTYLDLFDYVGYVATRIQFPDVQKPEGEAPKKSPQKASGDK